MKIAVYPGSFDPVTNGHLDIIRRAAQIFDKVIVAVSVNSQKKPLFTIEERMKLLKFVTKEIAHVEVSTFNGLLANFVEENHAKVIIKGLRAVSDFEYEFQMALMNKKLNPETETLFIHQCQHLPNEPVLQISVHKVYSLIYFRYNLYH